MVAPHLGYVVDSTLHHKIKTTVLLQYLITREMKRFWSHVSHNDPRITLENDNRDTGPCVTK